MSSVYYMLHEPVSDPNNQAAFHYDLSFNDDKKQICADLENFCLDENIFDNEDEDNHHISILEESTFDFDDLDDDDDHVEEEETLSL